MEKLSDKTHIRAFFQRLLAKRALLTVFINGRKEPYTSAVIEVDDNDNFILDELTPEAGNMFLKENPVIQLKAQLDGVSIKCHAKINEFGMDNNIAFYKLAIPDEIDYRQRRQAVRIRLSGTRPLPVTLNSKKGESFKGDIDDISIGGIRVRFKQSLSANLENGQHLNCSFLLPPDNELIFSCDLVIRVIKHDKDQFGPSFLGGEFMDMSISLDRMLRRSIMSLQRTSRQKDSI